MSDRNGSGGEVTADGLREEIALERAKNKLLLGHLEATEGALADADVESFGDVIPNDDRGYWRGQLIENREGTLGVLERLRGQLANRGAAAPAALPRPLHSRATVQRPGAGSPRPPDMAAEANRAARLRNRAAEIAKRDGIQYTLAFALAEREMG